MQATIASSHTPRLDSVASIVSISAFSASAESNSSLSIAALSCACGSAQTNNQISERPNAAKRRRDTNCMSSPLGGTVSCMQQVRYGSACTYANARECMHADALKCTYMQTHASTRRHVSTHADTQACMRAAAHRTLHTGAGTASILAERTHAEWTQGSNATGHDPRDRSATRLRRGDCSGMLSRLASRCRRRLFVAW